MRHEDVHTEIAGYRLAERIGSGGMGDVYKAYNDSLGRTAAIKILHQKDMAERFKNEAYIQSSISHPNIARLYEYTSCGDKSCIIMEYVEGESLDALLYRKKRLSNQETEDIIQQVVSALAYLHKKDIIHRDIKPQNFKIQSDGTVKMLDFGIAKHKYSPKFTQLGFVVGTTEYLAPEQFQQEPQLKSDVWALAVMTYELLTGYMPFDGNNPVTVQSQIRKGIYTDPKILIPQVSNKLVTVIEKGLKVNPVNRISAAGIETLMGKRKNTTRHNILLPRNLYDKKWLVPVIAGLAVIILLVLLLNSGDVNTGGDEEIPQTNIKEDKKELVVTGDNLIVINTPGIANAKLISPDGSTNALPYTVSGKEGDKFEFTIRAAGYRDKEVQVILSPRRLSYEFNLEKN